MENEGTDSSPAYHSPFLIETESYVDLIGDLSPCDLDLPLLSLFCVLVSSVHLPLGQIPGTNPLCVAI